jgi:hypothetical protein
LPLAKIFQFRALALRFASWIFTATQHGLVKLTVPELRRLSTHEAPINDSAARKSMRPRWN